MFDFTFRNTYELIYIIIIAAIAVTIYFVKREGNANVIDSNDESSSDDFLLELNRPFLFGDYTAAKVGTQVSVWCGPKDDHRDKNILRVYGGDDNYALGESSDKSKYKRISSLKKLYKLTGNIERVKSNTVVVRITVNKNAAKTSRDKLLKSFNSEYKIKPNTIFSLNFRGSYSVDISKEEVIKMELYDVSTELLSEEFSKALIPYNNIFKLTQRDKNIHFDNVSTKSELLRVIRASLSGYSFEIELLNQITFINRDKKLTNFDLQLTPYKD